MTIKRLRTFLPVPVARPELPRCEYDCTSNPDWREHAHRTGKSDKYASGRVMQCTFDAVVEINGIPMCRRHAGFTVLDMYISGELVEKDR